MQTPSERRALRRTVLVLAAALCALAAAATLHAQSGAAGRRFLFAYPDTLGNPPRRLAQYFAAPTFNDVQWIILFSEDSARVRLKGLRVTLDTVVAPGRSTVIRLDSAHRSFTRWSSGFGWDPTWDREVFELTADRDVSVTCYYATVYGAEAFVPLPVSRWGTRYYPATLPGDSILGVLTYITQEEDQYFTGRAPPRFTIIAADDATQVTIRIPDPINGARTLTVALDAGRMYDYCAGYTRIFGGRQVEETAGILITANKPIGVLAGNMRSAGTGGVPFAAVTRNALKNSLVEWIAPVEEHGRTFAFRTFADIGGERTGEHVRIIATSSGTTTITTTSGPWGDRRLAQGEAADLLLFAADSFDLRSYEIRASAPVEVINVSGPWSAIGTPSGDPGFGPEILAWSPATTTLVPRERWFSFTRFHVPGYPAQMVHTLTIVADAEAALWLDDTLLTVTERVFGSTLQCRTMPIASGDHVLRSRRGRFSGTVAGRARGHEAFRPMRARDDGKTPGGPNAAHAATYAENIAVSYAYPLYGMRLPDDSLETVSERGCDSLLVRVRTAGATPFDERYAITLTDTANVVVRRDSLFDGDLHVGWRIVVRPARRDADARATVVITDASGAQRRESFVYSASPVTTAPARIDLFSVAVGVERQTLATITNVSPDTIAIASIDLVDGTAGFRLMDAPLRAITLAPAATFSVRIGFISSAYDRQYRDSILVTGPCIEACVPLLARTTSIVPKPIPAIEGYDWGARWLSSHAACTKSDTSRYAGHVRLQNEGERSFTVIDARLVEDDGGAFAVDTSVALETIAAGAVIAPDQYGGRARLQRVTFAPTEEREYRAVYRVLTDGGDMLDAVLTGTGIESHIDVAPDVDLGAHELAMPGAELARATITVRALPTRALTVRELRLTGSPSLVIDRSGGFIAPSEADPSTWWRMAPGEARAVPIVFAPTDSGSATATLAALGDHSRCDDSIATVSASSYRVELRLDASVESMLGCGEGGGAATLTNESPLAFTLVSITITPPGAFTIDPMPPLSLRIGPGERLALPIRFHPSVPGAHAATLVLELRDSSGGGGVRIVTTELGASAAAITARAHVDSTHGAPGDRVAVTVWLDDQLDDARLHEIEMAIATDPGVVRILGSSLDNGIAADWRQTVLEQSDTIYRVRLAGVRPLAGRGPLMTLVLRGHLGPVLESGLRLALTTPDVPCVAITGIPGLYRLDSICGMSLRQITLFAESYALRQARPNPFNLSTTIPFSIGLDGPVRLEIFDARGDRVALLVDGTLASGRYEVTWNTSSVPSGVYISRLQAAGFSATHTLVLAR